MSLVIFYSSRLANKRSVSDPSKDTRENVYSRNTHSRDTRTQTYQVIVSRRTTFFHECLLVPLQENSIFKVRWNTTRLPCRRMPSLRRIHTRLCFTRCHPCLFAALLRRPLLFSLLKDRRHSISDHFCDLGNSRWALHFRQPPTELYDYCYHRHYRHYHCWCSCCYCSPKSWF